MRTPLSRTLRELLQRLWAKSSVTVLGLGDAEYPISPENFHRHFAPKLEAERQAQYSADDRCERAGIERALYNAILADPVSAASSTIIEEDPTAFDKEAISDLKSLASASFGCCSLWNC